MIVVQPRAQRVLLATSNNTWNLPGLASSSSWLLDSICQALALSEEGMPFLQRSFTCSTHTHTQFVCLFF